ncbi:redox-regulated ATPase YchF [Candidatus Parcubacteria bacterium]|nr:redox-regulated ATPase YchF [Candidatus Parcubacteria bacterium]
MALSIGIVGLPNVGKSTLFNALTKKSVDAQNYPFCTIDPSVGVVPVPDERLQKLAEFSGSKKILPAVIEFVDIAGLVEGASKGEGLGNKFLSNIRETDAILEMIRIFPIVGGGTEITHVYGDIDPLRDIKVINMELILADLDSVDKRIEKLNRDVKQHKKEAIAETALLQKYKAALEEEKMANTVELSKEESEIAKHFQLLTQKKFIYGLNRRSGAVNMDESHPEEFKKVLDHIAEMGAGYVVIDAKTEEELKDLDKEEKEEIKRDFGESHTEDGLDKLIQEAYKLLGLMTYFTTGPQETHGWTVPVGSTGPRAGRAIHTDFEAKYIRAQVIEWDKLLAAGTFGKAREAGTLRTEGKEYIVQDGDVIEFLV